MERKPTIVIFSSFYFPLVGGAETAVKGITDKIGDFNFVMLTGRYRHDLPREEKIGNILIYRLRGGKFLLPFATFLKFLVLKNKLPRPILFWGIMVSYASLGAYFLNFFYPRIPFLLTIQEGNKEWERNWFWWRLVLKKADYVTAISSFLLEEVGKIGYRGKAAVVPNGVDIEKFRNLRPDFRKNGKVIISVSRRVYKNGIDILEHAFEIVKKQFPDTELRIISDVPHDEIPKYLWEADVFVRPSRSEGLGTAFLEAMAAGLPIVATSVGGIKDFLIDGETGLEVRVDDPKDLAEKIELLFSDEALRQKLIQNGRKLVEEKYQWFQIAAKMREIFNSLL